MAPADFTTGARPVKAARGTELTAKSWQTEAPLRMLMNNLDPEVAERPDDLVVYGGTGRAVRSWAAFDAITRTLETMEKDETLLVQSGKPVGVFRTHEWAPRVLLANSNLVGDWATWPEFRRLEAEGLMMYGQMTAGSWIYIGTQGILQGTYETFAAVGNKLRRGGPPSGTCRGGFHRGAVGRDADLDGWLWWHGRGPAAGRDPERWRVLDCGRGRNPSAPPRRQAVPGRGRN